MGMAGKNPFALSLGSFQVLQMVIKLAIVVKRKDMASW
jgi:hypothetical protein